MGAPDSLMPCLSIDVPFGRTPCGGSGKLGGTKAWHLLKFSSSPALRSDSSAMNSKMSLHNSHTSVSLPSSSVVWTPIVKSSVAALSVRSSVANYVSVAS